MGRRVCTKGEEGKTVEGKKRTGEGKRRREKDRMVKKRERQRRTTERDRRRDRGDRKQCRPSRENRGNLQSGLSTGGRMFIRVWDSDVVWRSSGGGSCTMNGGSVFSRRSRRTVVT